MGCSLNNKPKNKYHAFAKTWYLFDSSVSFEELVSLAQMKCYSKSSVRENELAIRNLGSHAPMMKPIEIIPACMHFLTAHLHAVDMNYTVASCYKRYA